MNTERLLVLGDIHHAWRRAEEILLALRSRYDRVILLGDYFDDYDDTPETAAATARWLSRSLGRAERIHLLGNHDLPYFYPENPHLACPGFTVEKWFAARAELGAAPPQRFQLAHAACGWLFSHAGFARRFAEGGTPESLAAHANALLRRLDQDRYEPWLAPGFARGGSQPRGGITWLDWNGEFEPVPGLCQIVGHTPGTCARGRHLDPRRGRISTEIRTTAVIREVPGSRGRQWQSLNWCLDTGLTQVALIKTGKLEIIRP
jgi:hypothetical protein